MKIAKSFLNHSKILILIAFRPQLSSQDPWHPIDLEFLLKHQIDSGGRNKLAKTDLISQSVLKLDYLGHLHAMKGILVKNII